MDWRVIIGLETHVQLKTASKIFSPASTIFGQEPNTQVDAIDMSLPGTLPLVNKEVLKAAVTFGLAVGAKINSPSLFARKHYFYPDLPKGYQISQLNRPIVEGGTITILDKDDQEKNIQLTRAHLEEDAGKSIHYADVTGVDLNRAGTPLLEIVTEPVLTSAFEAVQYARKLHSLVLWLGICDGNMQEGSFRCDINISLHKPGTPLGTRTEIKNLNSFRFLEQAIAVEIERQKDILESGNKVIQETRLFDPDSMQTRSMRSKEEAQDYRYFPDPDILPLQVSEAYIDDVRATMVAPPEKVKARLTKDLNLSEYDATFLLDNRAAYDIFAATIKLYQGPSKPNFAKILVNILASEVARILNEKELLFSDCPLTTIHFAALAAALEQKVISSNSGKKVVLLLWDSPSLDVASIIASHNLAQVSDSAQIQAWVSSVIEENAHFVEEYQKGKTKALNALVGKVMKMSKGQANPQEVQSLLLKAISVEDQP